MLLLAFLIEISLGIFTYFNFENLFLRFLFFTLTTIIIALLVIKFANQTNQEEKIVSTEKS